jgi:hypothetical protein
MLSPTQKLVGADDVTVAGIDVVQLGQLPPIKPPLEISINEKACSETLLTPTIALATGECCRAWLVMLSWLVGYDPQLFPAESVLIKYAPVL